MESITKQLSLDVKHDEKISIRQPRLSKSGIPLIPEPSDDPFDPLNFSPMQKITILLVLCIWTFVGTFNMITVASAFYPISQDLDMSLTTTLYLVGCPLLAYGVASLIWVALGNKFGVRLIFLITSLAVGLFSIWGAEANSTAALIVARTLASVFTASPETLGPQAIADVFFLQDRAKCMGAYTLFQGSGFAIGALAGGFTTADLGWRWIQWITAFISLGSFVLIFLFFPETQYTRESNQSHTHERTFLDNFRVWSVSGGGRSKVEK
jgi:MFS family permease